MDMPDSSFLVLRIEGVLQSWGTRSRWDIRDSEEAPSKSGIIGMIGCALGYPVGDSGLTELDRNLKMGVRIDHPGKLMTDFHTVIGKKPIADGKTRKETIISKRAYLMDASFLVVLEGKKELIESVGKALNDPVWPIYLGRKSCIPSRPVFVEIKTDAESLETILKEYPYQPYNTDKQLPDLLKCLIEDPEGDSVRQDRFINSPKTARFYGERRIRIEYAERDKCKRVK